MTRPAKRKPNADSSGLVDLAALMAEQPNWLDDALARAKASAGTAPPAAPPSLAPAVARRRRCVGRAPRTIVRSAPRADARLPLVLASAGAGLPRRRGVRLRASHERRPRRRPLPRRHGPAAAVVARATRRRSPRRPPATERRGRGPRDADADARSGASPHDGRKDAPARATESKAPARRTSRPARGATTACARPHVAAGRLQGPRPPPRRPLPRCPQAAPPAPPSPHRGRARPGAPRVPSGPAAATPAPAPGRQIRRPAAASSPAPPRHGRPPRAPLG